MSTKIKNILNCAVMAIMVFGFCALFLLLPKAEFLDSERREPAKFPEVTLESIMKDGLEYGESFMKQFDDNYTPDNFPFRDFFRNVKAWVGSNVFLQKDKDGVYVVDGIAGEMQEEIDEESIAHAADRITFIYKTYLEGYHPLYLDHPRQGLLPFRAERIPLHGLQRVYRKDAWQR